ncbi:MAG: hypothetical protein PHC34_08125 [Candidatus Gastranaerophilales bacterium]|nr:hypothetical protein [Candidatus Gastranaerophilales bacterium]
MKSRLKGCIFSLLMSAAIFSTFTSLVYLTLKAIKGFIPFLQGLPCPILTFSAGLSALFFIIGTFALFLFDR